jgi:hypothetical protein
VAWNRVSMCKFQIYKWKCMKVPGGSFAWNSETWTANWMNTHAEPSHMHVFFQVERMVPEAFIIWPCSRKPFQKKQTITTQHRKALIIFDQIFRRTTSHPKPKLETTCIEQDARAR